MEILTKKLKKAHREFVACFGYSPEFPNNIDFDQDAFADELLKCVKDKFDYTIEKYGTKPLKKMPMPEIIWD